MMKELKYFLIWVVRSRSVVSAPAFYIGKVLQKFLRKREERYGYKFYPQEIKQLVPYASNLANILIKTIEQNDSSSNETKDAPLRISLASKEINVVDGEIDWEQQFDDPEDYESLHRWNWVLKLLAVSDLEKSSRYSGWIISQIEQWHDNYLCELEDSEKAAYGLRWESYTVSERISNLVLFLETTKISPTPKMIRSVKEFSNFLITRCEYYREGNGNHVFNNARALYLAGSFCDVREWREFARALILRELPILMGDTNFLREGSTHYQLLFTRWCFEIHYFSLRSNDELSKFLRGFIERLLKGLRLFLIENEKANSLQIIKMGDISPDFSPVWLLNLPQCSLGKMFLPPDRSWNDAKTVLDCWKRLYQEWDISWQFDAMRGDVSSEGWCRVRHEKFDLCFRSEKIMPSEKMGHFHNDFFHFTLFYDGENILRSLGRQSYSFNSIGDFGKSSRSHNSINLDGLGVLPDRYLRFPAKYSRSSCKVKIEHDSSIVRISLAADGFSRINNCCVERVIELRSSEVRIIDRILNAMNMPCELFYHWDQKYQVSSTEDEQLSFEKPGLAGSLTIRSTKGSVEVFNYDGLQNDLWGRVVDEYGVSSRSCSSHVQHVVQESPCILTSILRLNDM